MKTWNYTMKRQTRGFTLVELMIVVVIIGILASIAVPLYSEYIAKSRRAIAKSALQDLSQFMERYYTQNGRYTVNADGTGLVGLTPHTEAAKYYSIDFVAASTNAQAFLLRAVPAGPHTGDKCGTYQIDQAGNKSVTGNTGGTSATTCW